jgi:hypothetical protein
MKKLLLLLLLISTNGYAEIECENVDNNGGGYIQRCYIPEGWILTYKSGYGGGMTFYPDKNHEWKITK